MSFASEKRYMLSCDNLTSPWMSAKTCPLACNPSESGMNLDRSSSIAIAEPFRLNNGSFPNRSVPLPEMLSPNPLADRSVLLILAFIFPALSTAALGLSARVMSSSRDVWDIRELGILAVISI